MQTVAKRREAAFSLVEVTIALGLAAFAVVAVLGVLPSGLKTLRDSLDEVSEANLFREFAGSAARTSFAQLTNSVTYFSEQGLETGSQAGAHFKVEREVRDALVPGQSSTSNGAKVVLIKITRNPAAPGAGSRTTIRPVYVANSGF